MDKSDKLRTMADEGRMKSNHPSPMEFDKFIPWACSQLSVDASVVIIKTFQSQYVSTIATERAKLKTKPKAKAPSESGSESELNSVDKMSSAFATNLMVEKPVYIEAVYDADLDLVQVKFVKNLTLPRLILKIIGLILRFHTCLTSLFIDSGLNFEVIYEISKFLPVSRITEICLDNTTLREANYHILLQDEVLKYLSLSKCGITDVVVKNIAAKLAFPLPASKSLAALNMATNRITDLGCTYLADMLRSNRHLSYINLADNLITDKGAKSIFDVLTEFALNSQETLERNRRFMNYLKQKNQLIAKTIKELQGGEFERRTARRKSTKPILLGTNVLGSKKKNLDRDISLHSKSGATIDSLYLERAEIIAEGLLGPFNDPFSPHNTEIRNGIVHCHGNNYLSYLNLAYNNLTYASIIKLNEVLTIQKMLCRKPKGLINVNIEGNYLPQGCRVLNNIDDLLECGLDAIAKSSDPKKRAPSSKASNVKRM